MKSTTTDPVLGKKKKKKHISGPVQFKPVLFKGSTVPPNVQCGNFYYAGRTALKKHIICTSPYPQSSDYVSLLMTGKKNEVLFAYGKLWLSWVGRMLSNSNHYWNLQVNKLRSKSNSQPS